MKIKLIWDFRGVEAAGIAAHHAKHLTEFAKVNKLENCEAGAEKETPFYSKAFITVSKEDSAQIINILKPHRMDEVTD